MEMYNLVSLAGLFLLVGFAVLCSPDKKRINWRAVFWGTALQLAVAFFIFVVPAGMAVFLFINRIVLRVLNSAQEGNRFVFGRLALPPGTVNADGETSIGAILAFQGLPSVVFFAALMGMLYHLKIMPLLIRGFAAVFTRLMRISGAESLAVSANIFVGVESALTVRPHLERMTRSELNTVLTGCMATIASSVLGLYVILLGKEFPNIAGHLISASILSAPAAIVMSKILLPETGKPETLGLHIAPEYERSSNMIEAIVQGAMAGVKLVAGICALLLAFLGIVALIDLMLGALGHPVNRLLHLEGTWSLKGILGILFYPFTLALGVPPADAAAISRLIGERAVVTEVAAYKDLAALMASNGIVHSRSVIICTYALCGFAHIASLAIFVGGISALVPGRTKDLSALGLRALFAATLACLMTAAVAGAFFTRGSILLGY